MKPAVFLDRDGVVNEERSYVRKIEDFVIFPYVRECIKQVHKKGYLAIVLSNQSGVARGYMSLQIVNEIHAYLIEQTGIDKVYCCPHYEDGIIKEFAIKCDCRKPKTGMIKQARSDFDIDMSKSVVVGDRASDIMMGKNAGIRTVLLESGYGLKRLEQNIRPDYVLNDLRDVLTIL